MNSILKFSAILFFCLIFSGIGTAQVTRGTISGFVTDRKTNEPLVGVNVFISGTMWGASTNKKGYFSIKNIIPGHHEIAASIIGYAAMTREVDLTPGQETKLNFILSPVVYNIDEVNIISKRPREWFEYLKYFKMFFLGQSEYAWGCTLMNEYQLNFSIRDRKLIASCLSPVIVLNRSLGFRVDCVLREFCYDFTNNNLKYIFQPKFVELINRNKEELNDWKENREKAYLGSIHHFLKSLIKGDYEEQGFYMWLTNKPEENKNPKETIKADSIIVVDSVNNKCNLVFDKYLQVKYVPKETVSWIKLISNNVILDSYAYPKDLIPWNLSGDWGRLGVADMLPKYYFDSP